MKCMSNLKISIPPIVSLNSKRLIAMFLCFLMIVVISPLTVFASSSGSISTDKLVGEDTAQGKKTEYSQVELNEDANTEVYLTVDRGELIVGTPTVVILDGNADINGKHFGDYSVYAKGDIPGSKTLNIYPDTDVVTMKQKGKLSKYADIRQDLISFTSNDIADGMTTTGTISVEGLTAGSWNGEFSFNINMTSLNIFYSTLDLAVSDIEADTVGTENTTADLPDITDATCSVQRIGSAYKITLFKDVENQQNIVLNKDVQINLNEHTVSFANANNIVANADLTITYGNMNFENTARSITLPSNTSKFKLNKVTINSTSENNNETKVRNITGLPSIVEIIDSNVLYSSNVSGQNVDNVMIANKNSKINIKNSHFITHSNNAISEALYFTGANAIVNNCVIEGYSNANTNSCAYGLWSQNANLTITNCKIKAVTPTDVASYTYTNSGVVIETGVANFYDCDISVIGNIKNKANSAISTYKGTTVNIYSGIYETNVDTLTGVDSANQAIIVKGNLNINETDGKVVAKGGNCAIGVNDNSAVVNINGGTYSSPNHGGLYNANSKSININNAIMYNSKTAGEDTTATCTAYGGLYSSGTGAITISNSRIIGGSHCIRIKNEGSGSANVSVSNSYLEGQNDVLSLAAGTFTVGENVTLKSKTGRLLEANPAGTLVDPYNVFQLQ